MQIFSLLVRYSFLHPWCLSNPGIQPQCCPECYPRGFFFALSFDVFSLARYIVGFLSSHSITHAPQRCRLNLCQPSSTTGLYSSPLACRQLKIFTIACPVLLQNIPHSSFSTNSPEFSSSLTLTIREKGGKKIGSPSILQKIWFLG